MRCVLSFAAQHFNNLRSALFYPPQLARPFSLANWSLMASIAAVYRASARAATRQVRNNGTRRGEEEDTIRTRNDR